MTENTAVNDEVKTAEEGTEETGMSRFMRDLHLHPRLTENEERELAQACAQGDKEAIKQMVASNLRRDIAPMDVHKYTVVIWLEGDDPDCTDELIGGHIGMQMDMWLYSEEEEHSDHASPKTSLENIWSNLKFWEG